MAFKTICDYLCAKGYEPTKERGNTLTYYCPLHDERTPSFSVNTDRDFWYCHGACGEGGDLIKLILRMEGLRADDEGFRKAYIIRDGNTTTMVKREKKERKPREKKVVSPLQKDILTIMTAWWKKQLEASTYGADEARYYLIYSRGVSNAVMGMKCGAIGYCPYDPDGAYFRQVFKMIEHGYKEPGIHAALGMGIFYQDQNGGLHLSQQHRIMFSSFDPVDRQTVYFQGRIVSDDHLPGCYIGARGIPKAPFWIPIDDPIVDAVIIVESPLGPAVLANYQIPSIATLGNSPELDFLAYFPRMLLWAQDNDTSGESQAAKYERYCEKKGIPFHRLRPSAEEKDVDKWVLKRGIGPLLDGVREQCGEGLFKASCFVL